MRGKRQKGPAQPSDKALVAFRAFRAPAQGLSPERARAVLGPRCLLGEQELELLCDQMAVLAGIVLDEWQAAGRRGGANSDSADPRRAG